MKKIVNLLILAFFIFYFTPIALGQENINYTQEKGYIDFKEFDFFKDKEKKVEVFLNGPLLKFAAKTTAESDPETTKLLENLKLINVNVFEINNGQSQEVESIINDISNKLSTKNWWRIVRVKDKGEHVEIFTLLSDEKFEGLVIMVLNKKEAVFVNIVGDIKPTQLGKLSGKFNIPNLIIEKKGK